MMTRSLLDFIQKEQSLGASRSDIASLLGGRGWTEEDIAQAFTTLSDTEVRAVPVPPRTRIVAEACEMLSLMWSVYRSRWKRFLGLGLIYIMAIALIDLAFRMWILPLMPTFFFYLRSDDIFSAIALVAPYLMVGMLGHTLVQSWYVGTLYSVALKKGESLLERARTGLLHLPAVVGIKLSIALLLMIVFVPVLATTFLTQNPLVFIVFGPVFLIAAGFLGLLLSLALPAYFHGVPWSGASLRSIMVASRNVLPLLAFYIFFALLASLLFLLLRENPIVTVPVIAGFLMPMQSLLMIALYRRFLPDEPSLTIVVPQSVVPEVAPTPVTGGTEEKKETKPRKRRAKQVAA